MKKQTIVLGQDNVEAVDQMLDDLGIFAKPYTASIDGKITVIGMRIGEKPRHIIAFWGDSITITEEQLTLKRGVTDAVSGKRKS